MPSIYALGYYPPVDQSPLIGPCHAIDYFPPVGPCPAECRPFLFLHFVRWWGTGMIVSSSTFRPHLGRVTPFIPIVTLGIIRPEDNVLRVGLCLLTIGI